MRALVPREPRGSTIFRRHSELPEGASHIGFIWQPGVDRLRGDMTVAPTGCQGGRARRAVKTAPAAGRAGYHPGSPRRTDMEIDIRQIGEGDRLSRVLDAAQALKPGEVLTVFSGEDPAGLADSLRSVLGTTMDIQRIRWAIPDQPWVLHLKESRKPSSRTA
jgi:uncharacterized protein (DUF2249 family)